MSAFIFVGQVIFLIEKGAVKMLGKAVQQTCYIVSFPPFERFVQSYILLPALPTVSFLHESLNEFYFFQNG